VLTFAQHHVRGAGAIHRAEASHLPVQSDSAHGESAGQLIVGDVVNFECAGVDVAHDHVSFAGVVAEIAEAGNLPRLTASSEQHSCSSHDADQCDRSASAVRVHPAAPNTTPARHLGTRSHMDWMADYAVSALASSLSA